MLVNFMVVFLLYLPLISWAGQLIDFETAVKNHAEIDAKNKPSHTTLPHAPIYNNIVSFTPKDKNGDMDLHLATKNEDLRIMRKILNQKTTQINATNKNGQTALQVAILYRKKRAIWLLLYYKPNLKITNKDGDTALHLAAKNGDLDIIQMLIDLKIIDINTKNNLNQTAHQVAKLHGHKQAASLFKKYEDKLVPHQNSECKILFLNSKS